MRNGFVVPGTIKIKNSRLVLSLLPATAGLRVRMAYMYLEAETFTAVRDNDIPPYRYLVHLSERYIAARARARMHTPTRIYVCVYSGVVLYRANPAVCFISSFGHGGTVRVMRVWKTVYSSLLARARQTVSPLLRASIA